VTLAGNLDAAAQVFDQGTAATLDPLDPTQRSVTGNERSYKDVSITVFDSLGEEHELKVVLYKTGPSEWSWQIDNAGMDIDATFGTNGIQIDAGTNPFVFLNDGTLDIDPATFIPPTITFRPNSGADDVTITIDPRGTGVNGLTQFAGTHNSVLRDQNGYTSGTLQDFSIDRTGTIVGAFTNGTTSPLGQIVLSDFNNPGGLMRIGRQHVLDLGQLGLAGVRLRARRLAVGHGLRRARDVERRPGAGVHQHDRRRAWLPGEQPRDHDVGPVARGAGVAQAIGR
jgi:flagellar hook-basal body protein